MKTKKGFRDLLINHLDNHLKNHAEHLNFY